MKVIYLHLIILNLNKFLIRTSCLECLPLPVLAWHECPSGTEDLSKVSPSLGTAWPTTRSSSRSQRTDFGEGTISQLGTSSKGLLKLNRVG